MINKINIINKHLRIHDVIIMEAGNLFNPIAQPDWKPYKRGWNNQAY